MKKYSMLVVLLVCVIMICGCLDSNKNKKSSKDKKSNVLDTTNIENLQKGKHHAEIKVVDYGVIKVELDADSAPISVTNFMNLANNKFYDGLTFHRVIKGFVIQGGDTEGDGTGGSEQCIKGEFIKNGVQNKLSHKRGAISMARADDYDSASSQFFIVHKDAPSLNGEYAVFGYVIEGMEIVDAICNKVKTDDENDIVDPAEQPTIESIRVID